MDGFFNSITYIINQIGKLHHFRVLGSVQQSQVRAMSAVRWGKNKLERDYLVVLAPFAGYVLRC